MKKMIVLTLSLLSLTLFGCRSQTKQPDVITTLYPQYAIVKTIAEDKLHTTLIIPVGSDGHHFTPTSRDMMQIEKAKLFLLTSYEMEPWAKQVKGNKIDLSVGLEHEHHDHDDVHYFVSIDNQIHMAEVILAELIKIDPDHQTFYETNAQKLISDLNQVKTQFKSLNNPSIYYIGHDVFEAFTEETGIIVDALLSRFTDEANPTSQEIKTLIDNIKTHQIKVLYYDVLSMLDLAKTIKIDLANENYEISLEPFHSFHNVSLQDFVSTKSLADYWLENYEVIKAYHE